MLRKVLRNVVSKETTLVNKICVSVSARFTYNRLDLHVAANAKINVNVKFYVAFDVYGGNAKTSLLRRGTPNVLFDPKDLTLPALYTTRPNSHRTWDPQRNASK